MVSHNGRGNVKTRKLKSTSLTKRYTALFLKAPELPTKPRRTTLALVGKAYMVAGQAGVAACNGSVACITL